MNTFQTAEEVCVDEGEGRSHKIACILLLLLLVVEITKKQKMILQRNYEE